MESLEAVKEAKTTTNAPLPGVINGVNMNLGEINAMVQATGSSSEQPRGNEMGPQPLIQTILHIVEGQQHQIAAIHASVKSMENILTINCCANCYAKRPSGSENVISTPMEGRQSGLQNVTPTAPDSLDKGKSKDIGWSDAWRRLFESPSPEPASKKRGRKTPSGNNSRTPRSSRNRFRITPDMDLNKIESAFFTYVFAEYLDPNETLVKIGEATATRGDLQCLIPGQAISDKIIKLVALRTTCVHQQLPTPLVWCLPPDFSDDVFRGKPIKDLIAEYVDPWMKPSSQLQYIYIPIEDIDGHWFLMVVAFAFVAVYHVDSHPEVCMVPDRQIRMRELCGILFEIMTDDYYGAERVHTPHDLACWPILEGRGVPNCGSSENSGAWVISWIGMEDQFSPNLPGVLPESTLRAKTAVSLVTGPFNQLRRIIEKKASTDPNLMLV